jgi:hypothetical protein
MMFINSVPNQLKMQKNWKVAAAVIWASGIATCVLFWYPGGHYIGTGLLLWFIWISLVAIAFFKHRARTELLWASIPIVLLASIGPAFIILMTLPYIVDRLMGRSVI